jgi:DNA-binding LacI/PurR family transcriptional regulator
MSTRKPVKQIGTTSALARHLGLSRWTVSRALNGHPEVRTETRERVLRAMSELGFSPSPLARGLRGGRTGAVGVCFQALSAPIVARKVLALQRELKHRGLRAMVELIDGSPESERDVVTNFISLRVEGAIFVGGPATLGRRGALDRLADAGVPVVLVDPVAPAPVPTVELDRASGMRMALDHLLSLGHRRFLLLGIAPEVDYGAARWQGLRQAAADIGLEWERDFVVVAEADLRDQNYDAGRRFAERLLAMTDHPSAAIALNDQVAIGAIARLQEAGMKVPADLSIVGFDNLALSAHVHPRLTTLDQQVDRLMAAAVDLFLEPQSSRPALRRIEPELVVRDSTARCSL